MKPGLPSRPALAAGMRTRIAGRSAWHWLTRHLGINAVIVGICLALIGTLWTTVIAHVQYERQDTIDNAIRQNSNLAIAFEEQTIRTIKGIDAILLFVSREYAQFGADIDLTKYIEGGFIDGKLFLNVAVVNAHGDMLLSSAPRPQPINVADRDYFKEQMRQVGGKLLISKPVLNRITGRQAIPMTRRFNKPDGSFDVLVTAAVDPTYFTDFYQQADLGKQGMVQLVGLDGIVRARQTGRGASFGTDSSNSGLLRARATTPVGSYLSAGNLENIRRYTSYRTLPEYSLVVSVGTSQDEVLADFAKDQGLYYRAALLVSGVIALLAALLIVALGHQRRAVAALADSNAQFRATFDQAAVGIAHTTFDRRYLRVNQKFCDLLGYTRDELLGMRSNQIAHPDEQEVGDDNRRALAGEINTYSGEKRYIRKDGSMLWVHRTVSLARDSAGKPLYFIRVVEDTTERKRLQQELQHLADHDRLTHLPNRKLFYDRLEHALSQAQRRNWITGVMFIDLDGFKGINDTRGHDAGDQVLQQVSARLTECVRADDTVSRLGGDEFAVILSELARGQDGGLVAQKILDAMAKPFLIDEHEISITASIGVTTCPPDSGAADALVSNADAAMYDAKKLGKNNYQFYTAAMNERSKKNLLLEQDLRHALVRNEFVLHFQPKANLRTGMITGVEALLRWQGPGNSLVPPAEFIPLLEASGLIVPVGEWVLRRACAQIRAWQQDGLTPVPIAVNLSAKQFHQQDMRAMLMRTLQEYEIAPSLLELEITESAAMHDAEATIMALYSLKSLGVRLSIDDFGTGYSSLSYLKRFPINSLKIDRAFVIGLPHIQDDTSITQAIITMGHALRLKVIAEGVENAAQLEFLAAHGCDEMQGYYFSRPLSAADCTEFLRERKRLPHRIAPKQDTGQPAILLVDDDADTLLLFKRIFGSEDYEVLTASGAHDGFKLLAERNVKVVVSDQQMPGMSGVDFLRQVKSLSPDTVRVMLSGHIESKAVSDAINESEIHRFLSKNRDHGQLRRDIQAAYRVATSGRRGQLIPIQGGRAFEA